MVAGHHTVRSEGQRGKVTSWTPLMGLVVVGVAYFVLQLALFDERRFLEWDEAVYLGHASDNFASPLWTSHRSSGVAWLIRPLLLVSDSLVFLRIYLAALSAIAVGLAFSRWLHPGRWLAATAMVVFLSGWMPLFYGSEISPNLYVAAAAVAATGSLVSFLTRGVRIDLVTLVVSIALALFLRPSDGVVLAVGLGLCAVLVVRSQSVLRLLVAIAFGTVVGLVPWVLESVLQFGGPIERLRSASQLVVSGPTWNVAEYLRLADGPTLGPESAGTISVLLLAILAAYGLMIIASVLDRSRAPGPVIAGGMGLLMAVPYVTYVGVLAPRFLLPSVSLIAIVIAAGVLRLWEFAHVLGIAGIAVISVGFVLSLGTAIAIEDDQFVHRAVAEDLAAALNTISGDRACVFLSEYAYPQLMVGSGCFGGRAEFGAVECQLRDMQLDVPGVDVILVLLSPLPDDLRMSVSAVENVDLPSGWSMYLLPAGTRLACSSSN
jgi:hypothetical protein